MVSEDTARPAEMRILLLEDDPTAAQHIIAGMSDAGHDVHWLTMGDKAAHALLLEHYDVAIIDRMVPGMDGLSLVRIVRAAGCETPVLMLTALGGLEDRVAGINEGADDYLAKPYAFVELLARVHALGRRPAATAAAKTLAAGGIEINLLRREVTREGHAIDLQPREFLLLEQLLRHADRVVTKSMLLEHVWKFNFDPRTSVVETLVSRLRVKLNEGFDRDAIQTIRGAGYMIRADG